MNIFVGYLGDRNMQWARTAAGTCLTFTILLLPAALWLPAVFSAVALVSLIAAPCSIAALNGTLLHTMVRPGAIVRGTGIGSIVSAIGPWTFGKLIGVLNGKYWGGFLILEAINVVGAVCYFALHRAASYAKQAVARSLPTSDVILT